MTKIWIILLALMPFIAEAQNKISAVSFHRTSCLGRCPAYRLMVTNKGMVYYDGFSNTKLKGYYVGKVNEKKVQAIFNKYRSKKLLSLPDKYKNKISDISQLHITLKLNNKIKTIRHAHMAPPYIQQLAKDLDKLIAQEKIKWEEGDTNNMMDIDDEDGNLSTPPPSVVEQEDTKKSSEQEVFSFIEQMPEFPGGQPALIDFINKYIQYPESARNNSIQGKVVCSFIVDETGKVTSVQILRGVDPELDKEALRVMNLMPLWKPGMQNGKAVKVRMTQPFMFSLK